MRGRQRKSWDDNIKELTEQEFGDSLSASEDREDRERWKCIVATSSVVGAPTTSEIMRLR